ncbi:hypothetical protein KUCAC02_022307, partial [Chaenocephalus aceratus]
VSPWACESGGGDGAGQVWSSPQGGSPLTLFWRGTRVPPATQYFQHTALGGCLLLPTIKPIAGVSLGRKAPWSADCYPEMQLNCTVVLAKLFCLAREPGQKMKQSVESRAFLPMARSLGGQLGWVYAIH